MRANPAEAYRALTSARELCVWLADRAETDARSMGRMRIVWPKNEWLGETEAAGVFVDLEKARKVAWLWGDKTRPEDVPPLVTVFIEERPRKLGSTLTLVHAGFPGSASKRALVERYLARWEDFLAKLRLYLDAGKTCKNDRLTLSDLPMLLKRGRA
jgi:uncharacterized protein YndB with AHSA1/START domain